MKRIFLLAVMLSALASASHLSQLMQRYKHAPESQRYRIMNQIKLEIARLNKKRQRSAIHALRSISHSGNARQHTPKHTSSRTHNHTHRGHTTVRQGTHHATHAARSHHPSARDMLNGHSFGFGGGTHSGGQSSGSGTSSNAGSGSSSSGSSSGSAEGSGSSGGDSGDSGGFSIPGGGSMPGGMGGF